MALTAGLEADLTLSVQSLTIQRRGLFEAEVTGEARLAGSLIRGPTASGRIRLEAAEVRIPNAPIGRWGYVPEGLRHVGEDEAVRRARFSAGLNGSNGEPARRPARPLFLDLTLEAPSRVFVRGRGLDAELGGILVLGGTLSDTRPAGAFRLLRGRLDLLGKRFVLTDGSASFVGSFIPFVRLVASTESEGVVTSVVLTGTANQPEIRFESVPELPEDEVLARLLFGRSLRALSPFQAAQLALSVAQVTGQAEAGAIDRLRRRLGLDDLDISTSANGNIALRAGRRLGERLYTDLRVDTEGQSEVRLELELTPTVRLRGRADSLGRSALGIFFERDF